MTDADALLRAVLAAPDDDAPRLVYADWCEEHGDADRAAFIRAQVELARNRRHPDRDRLFQTERTLWRRHRTAWTAWLPGWAREPEFRRGFLERIRCDAEDYLAGADEVRLRTPLSGVRLDGPRELAVVVFLKGRPLDGLRVLTLSVDVPAEAWPHFAACPYLGQLEELNLNSKGPPRELVTALVESVTLGALRKLRLRSCVLGDEQTARLVRHPWAARLRTLDLTSNSILDEGGIALIESPHLDGLELLTLKGNPVTEGWLAERIRRKFGGRVRM
jgi:uncharacterized protein (TIGR02996 family)